MKKVFSLCYETQGKHFKNTVDYGTYWLVMYLQILMNFNNSF